MRILTVLCLLLVASACGGPQPSAAPEAPPPPPAAEPAPAPAPEPAPSATAPAAAQDDKPAAPADTKQTAESEATQSIFAVLKVKEPKAFIVSLDALRPDLEKAGVLAYVVSQGQDKTDTVIVHLKGRSGEKLKAFFDAEKAKAGGLFAKATEFFIAQDDAYQVPSPWPQEQTFSVFIRFKIKDFEAWRTNFDKNGELRAATGVLGYGIHHSLVDQRVIVHYLAKSVDFLRQVAAMPEVVKLMKEQGMAGVKPFYATNIHAQSLK